MKATWLASLREINSLNNYKSYVDWCSFNFALNKWASSWDYGTYHIGDQRRLRRACASEQSPQSIRCSHTCSMEVDERSYKNQTLSLTGWLRMHVWRMSLLRTKSTIISWDGSNKTYENCEFAAVSDFQFRILLISNAKSSIDLT